MASKNLRGYLASESRGIIQSRSSRPKLRGFEDREFKNQMKKLLYFSKFDDERDFDEGDEEDDDEVR